MNNDTIDTIKEKINSAFINTTKLHIVLKDKFWRNGFVVEQSADFFIFDDVIQGQEPIFFLEVAKVEPYFENGC